jgi:hypothetical protein
VTAAVVIIVIVVILVAAVATAFTTRLKGRSGAAAATSARFDVPVGEFHVRGPDAQVFFEVPLPEGGADDVLRDLLLHEAVEVVREKRHHLPIGEVTRVVAFGRLGGEWSEVGSVGLATPGELPPPVAPSLLPHHAAPDPLERIADLPSRAPGIEARAATEDLPPLSSELRLPASVEARLRASGVDPSTAGAGELVLGIMQATGYLLESGRGDDTWIAVRAGSRAFVRTVPHRPGEHPELAEQEVRAAVVDFIESGADRGLLVTEKYSPFEVYERERRDPRLRFITRERLQHFVDSLALG